MEDFTCDILDEFAAVIQLPALANFAFELHKIFEAVYLEFETNQSVTAFVLARVFFVAIVSK
jgi:hypothetical protein